MDNKQLSIFDTEDNSEVKKKLDTAIINDIFGINESFELPKVLLSKIMNESQKRKTLR